MKKPQKQGHLGVNLLVVRSPIFGGFQVKDLKFLSVHFRGLTKTFQSFYFEFPISAAQQEPIFRAVHH